MTKKQTPSTPTIHLDKPAEYRIQIQGRLDPSWSANFGGLSMSFETIPNGPTLTILRGIIVDQSALFGILNSLRNYGLPLLKVECLTFFASQS